MSINKELVADLRKAQERIAELEVENKVLLSSDRVKELEAELTKLREAVSDMNPNNPFSVIMVQAMVEEVSDAWFNGN